MNGFIYYFNLNQSVIIKIKLSTFNNNLILHYNQNNN